MPASCSRRMVMICSSENLPLHIIRLLFGSTDSSSDRVPLRGQGQIENYRAAPGTTHQLRTKEMLSLTPTTVALLDQAAKPLGMCRSDVIRRSLARDLGHVMSHEVPSMQRFDEETTAPHTSLLSSKRWLG
jgi:hypothetical protein